MDLLISNNFSSMTTAVTSYKIEQLLLESIRNN